MVAYFNIKFIINASSKIRNDFDEHTKNGHMEYMQRRIQQGG